MSNHGPRHPFQEVAIGDNVFIRLFRRDCDTDELVWHFDLEDREIHVLKAGGWKYQQDHKKLRKMKDNEKFFIPTGVLHRVVRGHSDFIIKVKKS